MAWDEELNLITRALINDPDSVKFTDDRVNQVILTAMMQIQMELRFPLFYTVDIVNERVTPDPTIGSNRDDNFVNLVTVKSACIMDRGAAAAAADQAIRVKDGASEVDLRSAFMAKLDLIKQGWCAVYSEMKNNYVYSQTGQVVGAAILTPFRLFAGYGNDMPFGQDGVYRWGSR